MISATFDGAEREFRIRREHVPYLERAMGRPLYAILRDFTAGEWRFDDVAAIVSFALHGPAPSDRQAMAFARQAAHYGVTLRASYAPHRNVVAVLERDGHGNFASLAADILTDTIFGDTKEASDA
ncbi:gene transfer agent family protein [Nitratireductor aquibiodomus]|uniref:GTA-gp10 family protein n=1 Tax=Nitratireductor aquibiodomus TaxID=204799 RepID=UPI0019D34405|nr:GTA-gp10 family protein [Nitratireductor aquibiodomus]MBN7759986.1 gene transfer agent family protein [Nitratireductor aquibiodomus]